MKKPKPITTAKVEPLRDVVLRLTVENNLMRKMIADSDLPCMYCKLPKAEISRCEHGFPGCGRADDILTVDLGSPV